MPRTFGTTWTKPTKRADMEDASAPATQDQEPTRSQLYWRLLTYRAKISSGTSRSRGPHAIHVWLARAPDGADEMRGVVAESGLTFER